MPMEWMERLQWRHTPPEEPGFYWFVALDGDPIDIMQWVRGPRDGRLRRPGYGHLGVDASTPDDAFYTDYWWAGPITPPPFTVENVEHFYRKYLPPHVLAESEGTNTR